MCLRDHEIDQFLALKPAGPRGVALPFDHVQSHHSAQLLIPVRKFAGVLFVWHHAIAVPMNVVDRDVRLGQSCEPVSRRL